MWRCRNTCRYLTPYFGFLWMKESREPSPNDLMWIPSSKCEHQFEKIEKDWLTDWDCIIIFNEFISENNIQIQAKVPQFNGSNNNVNTTNDSFAITINTKNDTVSASKITNELYINFDRETEEFMNVNDYLKVDANVLQELKTVCIICLCTVADVDVIEHLKKCCGIEFSLDSGESLPIFKID